MKKSGFVIIPVVASLLFAYSCDASIPDRPTAYNFTFTGTNCNIEFDSTYETKIYEGDKNITFIINSEYDYILTQEDITISGDNTTYNETTHELIISEVTGNVAVNANAIKKPTFTFHGYNCNIQGEQDITNRPLEKGAEYVTFPVTVDSGCILEGKDLVIMGENVQYDGSKIIITKVVGPVEIRANAYANKIFDFTGTNCTINGNSKVSGEPLKLGAENVKFAISYNSDYFLKEEDVEVLQGGGNVTYDETTRTLTIHKVSENVVVKAEAKVLTKAKITVNLTNCHLSEELKENGYIVGSKVRLKILGNTDHSGGLVTYEIPKTVHISNLSADKYKYNSDTGVLIIDEMPNKDIEVTATSEVGVDTVFLSDTFGIVLGENLYTGCQDAYQIWDAMRHYNPSTMYPPIVARPEDLERAFYYNTVYMDNADPHSQALTETIPKNPDNRGYAIKVETRVDEANRNCADIIIGYQSKLARTCAVDRLLTDFGLYIPLGLNVTGTCPDPEEFITNIDLPEDTPGTYREIRDPFIYRDGNDYYMYGTTNWNGDVWRVYSSQGGFTGPWKLVNPSIVDETQPQCADIDKDRWAPEIHKFNDKYYMFTTYKTKTKNDAGLKPHGVTIFQSDSLTEGFTMISEHPNNKVKPGHITDDDVYESTIDGSLYVTKDGTPWLVYVDEWIDNHCGYGFMDIVPFQDNTLTKIDQNRNTVLFSAHDSQWAGNNNITDGCFIHRSKDDKNLTMLWSNNDRSGNYAIGLLCNYGGDEHLDDPNLPYGWRQQERTLYAKGIYDGAPNGGHGMIFDDPSGQLYLCLHINNDGPNTRANIIPVKEAFGTLVWDLYNHSA